MGFSRRAPFHGVRQEEWLDNSAIALQRCETQCCPFSKENKYTVYRFKYDMWVI
jgi:hypothetical protein